MQEFKHGAVGSPEEGRFDLQQRAGTQVCVLCVWVCWVSRGPASWGCHPFAYVFCSYMKGKQRVPSSLSLFSHLSFPSSTGQSWETNRNKLSALKADPLLEAEGEAAGRPSWGEMELDRCSSANKNSSDSWKQLIWLTISTNLKSAIEIFFHAKRGLSERRERQVFCIYTARTRKGQDTHT